MKLKVLFICLLFVFAKSSKAQQETPISLSFAGGVSFNTASQGSSQENQIGYNLSGGLDFPCSRVVSFTLDMSYSNIPFDGNKFVSETGLSEYGISVKADPAAVLTVLGSFKIALSSTQRAARSYIVLGAGYFGLSMDNITISDGFYTVGAQEISISAFSASIGFGIDVPLGQSAKFFIEARYNAAFAEAEVIPFVPAKAGFQFGL